MKPERDRRIFTERSITTQIGYGEEDFRSEVSNKLKLESHLQKSNICTATFPTTKDYFLGSAGASLDLFKNFNKDTTTATVAASATNSFEGLRHQQCATGLSVSSLSFSTRYTQKTRRNWSRNPRGLPRQGRSQRDGYSAPNTSKRTTG
jgi:hypothetical protein